MRGGLFDRVAYSAPNIIGNQTIGFLFFILWRTLGMMLIGMGLLKLGVLSGSQRRSVYLGLLLCGYGLGIPLALWDSWRFEASGFSMFHIFGSATLVNHISVLLVTAGHVGLIMWMFKGGLFMKITARLAAVGRMALTNYLSQTIILTTVFYWFGLFGNFSRTELLLFVIGVWALQLWWSPVWLRYFRFGPMEWLWRSLTYRRRQPMRRFSQSAVSPD
jgi:uncharacterized protein